VFRFFWFSVFLFVGFGGFGGFSVVCFFRVCGLSVFLFFCSVVVWFFCDSVFRFCGLRFVGMAVYRCRFLGSSFSRFFVISFSPVRGFAVSRVRGWFLVFAVKRFSRLHDSLVERFFGFRGCSFIPFFLCLVQLFDFSVFRVLGCSAVRLGVWPVGRLGGFSLFQFFEK
jgi:hypothetical protein